jgi:hypothetical protein
MYASQLPYVWVNGVCVGESASLGDVVALCSSIAGSPWLGSSNDGWCACTYVWAGTCYPAHPLRNRPQVWDKVAALPTDPPPPPFVPLSRAEYLSALAPASANPLAAMYGAIASTQDNEDEDAGDNMLSGGE